MTHNERVLGLLRDGKPHTHHEIYALYVVGHSRISDLRAQGHVIEQWREGDAYLYQLQSSGGAISCAGTTAAPSETHAAASNDAAACPGVPDPPDPAPGLQLQLEVAA